MYLLNLSVLQFVAVFGSVSAVAVALYLFDRSRRRQVVSTLGFWVAAEHPIVAAKRKHIQQPWSLILQLAGMALLLLAVAQLRLGSPAQAGRDHVIVLDTSAWMSARTGNRTLMDLARERARRYLRALPSRDRVMLVRADAMASPATAFEPDHGKVDAAINATEPGSGALNLDQALAFARHVQAQQGGRAGEIAYIGPGRIGEHDPNAPPPPAKMRVLLIPDNIENAGIRKVGLRRSSTNADTWEIYVSARNYGAQPRNVTLSIDFGPPGNIARTPAGSQHITLPAGGEKETGFQYRTSAAGVLGVHLTPHDAFPADDYAEIELPSQPNLLVTVYSNEPDLLRPILSSTPRVNAIYRKPEEYRPGDRGLVVLDRFIPARRPTADSVWIDPPANGSPIAIRQRADAADFKQWDTRHPVAAGLRAKDFKFDKVSIFDAASGDGRIAEVAQGPIIVARPSRPKIVALGFHPALTTMRYELVTPLLFANILRWVSPEIFRHTEIAAGSVGAIRVAMDSDLAPETVKVTGPDSEPLPFSLHDRVLQFFAGEPGTVRVVAGDREYVYSLTLPQLAETRWDPPPDAPKTIPRFTPVLDGSTDLWPWLALAGAACLFAEWLLYGRFRRFNQSGSRLLRWKPAAWGAGFSPCGTSVPPAASGAKAPRGLKPAPHRVPR